MSINIANDSAEQRRTFAAAITGAQGDLSELVQAKVKEAYTLNSRFYHDWAHASDIGQPLTEPLYDALKTIGASTKQIYAAEQHQILAGFYHDVVYAPVDNLSTGNVGVTPEIRQQLEPYIDFINKPFKIRENIENTSATEIVFDMFGEKFKPGSALNPFGGQNEFLSALVMAQDLESIGMPSKDIAMIAQRIAVTIPFDTNGPVTDVDKNLRVINERQQLGLNETELRASFVGTIDLANRDVKGFGGDFTGYNIGTRNLLPEARPELRNAEAYKPEHLYTAVLGAAGFTGGVIKPNTIFHQARYDDVGLAYPSNEELKQITDKAKDANIPSGVVYLEALAAAAALTRASLAAQNPETANLPANKLANVLAGASVSDKARDQMLGSLSSGDQRNVRDNVQNAIETLRSNDPGFQPDAKLRETAAKLLETFGPDGVRKIAQEAKDPEVKFPMPTAMKKFDSPEAAQAFLAAVERDVITPATQAAQGAKPSSNLELASAIGDVRNALKGELDRSITKHPKATDKLTLNEAEDLPVPVKPAVLTIAANLIPEVTSRLKEPSVSPDVLAAAAQAGAALNSTGTAAVEAKSGNSYGPKLDTKEKIKEAAAATATSTAKVVSAPMQVASNSAAPSTPGADQQVQKKEGRT